MSRTSKVDVVFLSTLIGILFISWRSTLAHVAFTYPPARKYDLDFLDNLRTPGPCGMPKGERRTTVVAGLAFNVTWHLAYPHRGGYKLELLNDQGKPWMDLTPINGNSDFVNLDTTAQRHLIRIPPNISCKGCSLRLKREATEWANNYTFWSCADINVVSADTYQEDCFGQGKFKNGICLCNKLFSGPRCQYKDECWDDGDCGKHGKCIDINATSFPKKQCYCQLGWFGQKCQKESSIKAPDIDLSHHQSKDLSATFKLFWKVIHDIKEIEIVMQVKSTTYISLGWRPKGLASSCKSFPTINGELKTAYSGEHNVDPQPEPEPESKSRVPVATSQSQPSTEFALLKPHTGNATEVKLEDTIDTESVIGTHGLRVTNKHKEDSFDGRTLDEERRKSEFYVDDVSEKSSPNSETHAVAESNPHLVTLEVTAKPVDVRNHEDASEFQVGGAETAHESEVNYGVESADDGLIEYTHAAHTTPASKSSRRTRAKRQSDDSRDKPVVRVRTLASYSTISTSPVSQSENSDLPIDGIEFTTTASSESSYKPLTVQTSKLSVKPLSKSFYNSQFRRISTTTTSSLNLHPSLALEVSSPLPSTEEVNSPSSEGISKSYTELEEEYDGDSSSNPTPEHTVTSDHSLETSYDPLAEPTTEISPLPEPSGNTTVNSSRHSKARKDNDLEKSVAESQSESELTAKSVSSADPSTSTIDLSGPYTPKLDFHAMDCTDIVTGMAQGLYSRIQDQYTRDRSTPREDSYWGGFDSLTLASGFEQNGITTIIFRRKLESDELTDHSIHKGPMHVIWAQGQEPGAYVHFPLSGLESEKASVPNFYHRDEFKYHGHRSQRGIASIDFFDDSKKAGTSHLQNGEWKMPESCRGDGCQYRATWEYLPAGDSIRFTITTNQTDKWTGIGFSEDTRMPKTDAIIGWVGPTDQLFVMDTWLDGYDLPKLDANQDVTPIKGSKTNNRYTFSFIRKRNTGDKQDLAFTDDSCLYMFFIYDGGAFNYVSRRIEKHASIPAVSTNKICITGDPDLADFTTLSAIPPIPNSYSSTALPPTTSSTNPPKPFVKYLVDIRLPNQTLHYVIERDFEALIKKELSDYMTRALKKIDGFERVDIITLQSEEHKPHVVAKMHIYIDKGSDRISVASITKELNATLNATIANGTVGRLLVDPAYLTVKLFEGGVSVNNDEDYDDENVMLAKNDDVMVYAIIAAVAAFGVLLLIQIFCSIYRWIAVKRTRVSKERLIAGTGWKDYTASGSNGGAGGYGYENFGASSEETPKVRKHQPGSSNGTSRSLTQPPSNGNSRPGHFQPGETRSLNRNTRGIAPGENDRNHYSRRSESLPRANGVSGVPYSPHERGSRPLSAASLHPQGGLQPDFYFMPSQRRYSGEVVRVYVDYNNPNYTGK